MVEENSGYCGMSMKKVKIREWICCYGKYVLCVALGVGFYLLAECLGQEAASVEKGVLYRNSCGQGDVVYQLLVDGLEEPFSIEICVPEQELSEEAFRAYVPEMAELLLERMVGENSSLQAVQTDLELVSELPEYGVDVSWDSNCPEVIENDGTVHAENAVEVILEAKLRTGNVSEVLEIPVMVFPTDTSLENRFYTVLEAVVLQNMDQREVVLPKEFEGKTVQYRSGDQSSNEILLGLGIVAAICLFLKEKEDAVADRKRREDQLMEDYPDFIYEFLILVGAGYSAKAAWKKMTKSYLEDVRKMRRPLCKEMQFTLNQMETGVPETRAYIEFGRRCGNRSYVKFSSLLESSISTGGKNLRKLLETEMKEAFELRTDMAKRKGEEASTRLLLPTFMMLGVVLVMVTAPAFLTMI